MPSPTNMTPPKNSFAFAPLYNSPAHSFAGDTQKQHASAGEAPPVVMSHDATGAFQPGVKYFKELYSKNGGNVGTLLFDNHSKGGQIFDSIIHAIQIGPNQLDAVAYFGHGYPHGMASAHIAEGSVKTFAAAIRANCNPGVKIMLYACSCARQNVPPAKHGRAGCFAQWLASALADVNATVYGHDIAGHSYRNPTLYRYNGNNMTGTKVAPPGMDKAFRHLMHDRHSDFWARFPFMTDGAIKAEVAAHG